VEHPHGIQSGTSECHKDSRRGFFENDEQCPERKQKGTPIIRQINDTDKSVQRSETSSLGSTRAASKQTNIATKTECNRNATMRQPVCNRRTIKWQLKSTLQAGIQQILSN
jgi:hypothetical protein